MLAYKTYVKILFFILIGLIIGALFYAYYFTKNYPLPITGRISFDAKITFIKEHIDRKKVDTIIVGSSIGLNNVQGAVLEAASQKCQSVLNLSVYEATPTQVEQVLELISIFPHLKRILYSAQYSDFGYAGRLQDYDPAFIKAYLAGTLTLKEKISFYFHSCQNIFFCIRREWNWKDEHLQNNQFGYLGFDATGSVPLHIYGKDIIISRWEKPHFDKQSKEAFTALERMSQKAHKEKIDFIFVVQPYREPLVKNFTHVRPVMQSFSHQAEQIVTRNGGKFLNLHDQLHMNDRYFSDRSHLNDQGSIIGTEAIGKFIDQTH